MQCPVCKSLTFYVKDIDDEYETYRFDFRDNQVCFDPEVNPSDIPELTGETETYCDKCAWHGKFKTTG